MSRRLEHLLREWGAFQVKHMFHHMEYGENILYRAGIMGGRVQDPGDGHKILCPDTPRHLQAVDIALNRIDPLPAKVVRVWYCAPQKEDGEAHTKAELVLLMRENGYRDMSLAAFDKNLNRGRRLLQGMC
jgi:hypothetical protein